LKTFTIEEVAALIANKYGWHEGAQNTLLTQLLDAATDGTLTVRHPHTDLPYRPKQCHEYYERVSVADLNRWFEVAGVPWRLDNDGETADPLFDTEWWNLHQALAWVYLGDRGLVKQGALVNEDAAFAIQLKLEATERQGACYPSFSAATKAICEALQTGKLIAYGLKNDRGDLTEIPSLQWVDHKFYWGCDGPNHAAPGEYFRLEATRWFTLRFRRKAILVLWPDPFDQLPAELLALGDQQPQDIDWNYWTTLDLWPIDVACKLVCGINPNEPRRREDIENPDTLTRPAWANLFHKTQAAIMSGKLRVQAGCVYPAEFVIWAEGKGIQIPGGLARMNLATDQPRVEAGSSQGIPLAVLEKKLERDTRLIGHDTAAATANPFPAMDGLTWADITITFIGTESVRVRARGRNETFTFDAMGFRHRTSHMAKPNECWKTFLRLAIVRTSNKTWSDFPRTPDLKKRISRLREQLRRFFGIAADPIAYKKGEYQAAFNLTLEEQVIQPARERYADCADDDTEDDIQRVMSEPPGWSR
jgi:hypothetical protein